MKHRKPTETKPQDVKLDDAASSALALSQERITAAATLHQLRQTEMQNLLLALRARYEEGGRFEVVSIDVGKMVLTRRVRGSAKHEQPATEANG